MNGTVHSPATVVFGATSFTRRKQLSEVLARIVLLLMTCLMVLPLVLIVVYLFYQAWPILSLDFLLTNPRNGMRAGGIWSPLLGTIYLVFLSLAIATPIGVLAAVFLNEYAPGWLRSIIKPVLEVLAGIPTVVLGFFALTFLARDIVQPLFGTSQIFSALAASIAVGIMIIPLISSLSEDAMAAVPRSLRDGAYALGATRFEVARRVVVPAALSGILAAFILGISRAIGETMIVALAAGSTPNLTYNPLEAVQTMTAYIVQVSLGDTPQGSIEFRTIFAVGMTLFLLTLGMNIVSQYLLHKFREVYE